MEINNCVKIFKFLEITNDSNKKACGKLQNTLIKMNKNENVKYQNLQEATNTLLTGNVLL